MKELYEGMICPECSNGYLYEQKQETGEHFICDKCKFTFTTIGEPSGI